MIGLDYYVYAYVRKSDGTPYYIGKGKGDRAFVKHKGVVIPKSKSQIVFLETGLSNIGALALERRYVEWYGRKDVNTGVLRNKTPGGDAPPVLSGDLNPMKRTEVRAKITGENHPFFRKSRPWMNGSKNVSTRPEVRAKLALQKLGANNPMAKPDVRAAHLAAVRCDEYRQQFSGDNNPRALAVVCLNTMEVFPYIRLAAKWCDVAHVGISRACKGKAKSAGKHPETKEPLRWSYA